MPGPLSRTFSRASGLARTMTAATQSHDIGDALSRGFSMSLVHDEEASPYFESQNGFQWDQDTINSKQKDDFNGLSVQPTTAASQMPDLERRETLVQQLHGFFSSSLRSNRVHAFRAIAGSLILMGVLIMGILSIYWGSYYNRDKYLNRVQLWIINMDDAPSAWVGPAFISISTAFATAAGSATVVVKNASDFDFSYENVYAEVLDQKTWGAYIIASNATTELVKALENPADYENYDGSYSVQFAYPQAEEQALFSLLSPWLSEQAEYFRETFANEVIRTAGQNSSMSLSDISQHAPQLLSTPVSIYDNNMRPMTNPLFTAVMQIGLIYLIIISFFQFNFFQPVHMTLAPQMKRSHYILYRLVTSWLAYFVLSLFYSLISLAYQVDFTLKFGRAGFFIYWMINWIGMTSVGGACENVALVAIATFPPLLGFWMIFMVISNVAPAFFSIKLLPAFYRYGYAFPIKNVCDALKTVLFGTRNTMGRNIGVIFAWIAVNTILFPLCVWFSGYNLQRKKAAAMAKALEKR
ncbi:uncharacterized protein V1518DRAFT_437644 [Limtongia smithiae]|uniref:uncharacterized protein n=1 Tax=Limtongia smithiae TaxID=1125753 RepID=UPI0034CF8383